MLQLRQARSGLRHSRRRRGGRLTCPSALLATCWFVVLKRGCPASPEFAKELQEFVKAKLTAYKCPRRIEFLPELPKSAAGKLLRYKLQESGS